MVSLITRVKMSLRTKLNAIIQVKITSFTFDLVILRRFENDVLFEELGHWNGLEAMANTVIGNMMAVIFEKYGKLHQLITFR